MKILKLATLFGLWMFVGAAFAQTYIQKQTLTCGTYTNPTITLPSASVAGHSLVWMQTGSPVAATVKTNVGQSFVNIYQSASSEGVAFANHYILLNALAATSVTLTVTGWTGCGVLYELPAGYNADDNINTASTYTSTLGTYSSATTSVQASYANEVIFCAETGNSSAATLTGDLTSDYTSSTAIFASALKSATGTYSCGMTWASGSSRPTINMIRFFQADPPTAYGPIFSPVGGKYGPATTVAIAEQNAGGVAHCTTDGSTPTSGSPATTSVTVASGTEKIQCLSVVPGMNNSTVISNSYTITGVTTRTTWYIRADGGSRYSSNATSGQCDGQGDVAYLGSGTNQHCAFNDVRYLWDDQSYNSSLITGWAIQGGDRIIIRSCAGNANQVTNNSPDCRIGFDNNTGPGAGYTWCVGGGYYQSGGGGCMNPPIPSGTASQHTQILGQNYAACSTSGGLGQTVDKTKLTTLFGGYGLYYALNLTGAQYVDVQCLGITSHSACSIHASPPLPHGCDTSTPEDYDSSGVGEDHSTHDVLMQDMWIHGHTDRDVKGPIGGTVTCQRCVLEMGGDAGWDFDDGTTSAPGEDGNPAAFGTASYYGTWNFLYSQINLAGCNQNYPGNVTTPYACYSQSSGGYGDAVGSPPGSAVNLNVDHSIFSNNTQDAIDVGHTDAGTSGAGYSDQTNATFSITNSYGFANNGAGLGKWGPNNSPANMFNNVIINNCRRMAAAVSGWPSTYNQYLADFCRSGDAVALNFHPAGTGSFSFNTVISYFDTTYLIGCWDGDWNCPGTNFTFKNNISYGLENAANSSYNGNNGGVGGFYFGNGGPPAVVLSTWNRSNNQWFGVRTENCSGGYAGELCSEVLFLNEWAPCLVTGGAGCTFTESTWDPLYYTTTPKPSFTLTASSPANGAGVAISGITTDFYSALRPVPPGMGAVEYGGILPASSVISGNVVFGGTIVIQPY